MMATRRVTGGGVVSETDQAADGLSYLLLDDEALLSQCEVDVYRASGPGGQKRNKTSSAVRVRHRPTGLMAHSVEDRSQHVNKRRAVRRLRECIALSVRRAVDPNQYTPTELLRSYVINAGQLRINRHNADFPLVAAEVLDVIAACQSRVSDAAERLRLSTAHLVEFLSQHPQLWKLVNEWRKAAGHKPLR